jgi:Fic family protein
MTETSITGGWPPTTFETRPWRQDPDVGLSSRTARRAHRGPYQAAVTPLIANHPADLSGETAAHCEDAAQEIIRFDTELGGEIAPFSAVLMRSESAASSEIENLTASARAIAEALTTGRGSANAKVILGNVAAMQAALGLADRLDLAAILSMHRALLKDSQPAIAGRLRERQVWIGGGGLGPHRARFVPPHHERIPAALADLLRFVSRDNVPVLAHAAIAHAQFETIHPFEDGNGRTGRALLHAMLRGKGLVRNITVPLSAGLLTDTDGYFAALTSFQKGDIEPMARAVADAGFAAVENGRRLVADLRTVRAQWRSQVRARANSRAWPLLDLLVNTPVVNASLVADHLDMAIQNVYGPLRTLVEAGVLVEFTDRSRNRAWRAPAVLDCLDAFAARAGRRTLPTG